MIRAVFILGAGTILAVSGSLVVHASEPDGVSPPPPPTVIIDGGGTAFDFGAKGTGSASNSGGGSGATPAVFTPPPVCVLVSQPITEGPLAGGSLVRWECTLDNGGQLPVTPFVYQAAGTPAAPPPNPAVLAEEAYSTIQFSTPTPHLAPYTELAVKYWNYLWVDNPGPLTASAGAAGLTVTATATLASSTWSMGEWRSLDDQRPVASFSCAGGGAKPPANPEWNVAAEPSTDCAYWFQWRSLKDRTSGLGTWPVTVSTTWDITWTATNGMTGAATRTQTSAPVQVAVGEWRTVTVAGDDAVSDEGGR